MILHGVGGGGEGGSEALKFVLRNLWTAKKLNILVGIVFFWGGRGNCNILQIFPFYGRVVSEKRQIMYGKAPVLFAIYVKQSI